MKRYEVICPYCLKIGEVPDEKVGEPVVCSQCDKPFRAIVHLGPPHAEDYMGDEVDDNGYSLMDGLVREDKTEMWVVVLGAVMVLIATYVFIQYF